MGKRIKPGKKLMIWARDNYKCFYCGITCTDPSNLPTSLTVDHRDPLGGKDASNLVTACRKCNHQKGDYRLDAPCIKLRAHDTRRLINM